MSCMNTIYNDMNETQCWLLTLQVRCVPLICGVDTICSGIMDFHPLYQLDTSS